MKYKWQRQHDLANKSCFFLYTFSFIRTPNEKLFKMEKNEILFDFAVTSVSKPCGLYNYYKKKFYESQLLAKYGYGIVSILTHEYIQLFN